MLELSLSVINEVLSATAWLTYLKFICVSFQGASTCPHVKGDALCLLAPKRTAAMWKTSGCQLVRSQSNASITTCECDHLTVFAALMDPYGLNVGTTYL